MGCQYTGMDNTDPARVMVTGREKFRKFIAGLMIMVKMEENLFRKQNHLEPMKASLVPGNKLISSDVTRTR